MQAETSAVASEVGFPHVEVRVLAVQVPAPAALRVLPRREAADPRPEGAAPTGRVVLLPAAQLTDSGRGPIAAVIN